MNCGQHQDSVQLGGSFYKVYNNYLWGLANSDMESDWSDTVCGFARVWNNVFTQSATQPHSHGIEMATHSSCSRSTDFRIYNNTWIDFWGFVAIRWIFDTTSTMVDSSEIKNNIIYNSRPYTINTANYPCGVGIAIDHNNINANAGVHGSTGGSSHGSTYNGTNTQSGAPAFVSYTEYGTNNDLHLTASSAADIDKGVNLATYFATDKDGTPRPQRAAWDIGAYEYASGSPSPTPTPSASPSPSPSPTPTSSPLPVIPQTSLTIAGLIPSKP
jgi:hypothetical protein